MWIDSTTYLEDLERVVKKEIFGTELEGKHILVTGATGLIGQNLVNALLFFGLKTKNPPKITALVRNAEKAQKLFQQQLQACGDRLSFLVGDITNPMEMDGDLDYIIHGASQTASLAFVQHPVETIETALIGTKNVLELAKRKQVKSMVYLSSMEAYGFITEKVLLSESGPAMFDSMAVRNCYPESKRMCESMCSAYAAEYGVAVKVIRLAQTFGPGILPDDKRVFADFAQKAVAGEDIVLLTTGESCRMYLYTMDAVTATLTVLINGVNGVCYNAANRESYCSIRDMAELVARVVSAGRSKVVVQLTQEDVARFSPVHRMFLDTTRIENLGWSAEYGLEEMYRRMVKGF